MAMNAVIAGQEAAKAAPLDALRIPTARLATRSAWTGTHTFRATGITAYLENGGQLKHAQTMAAHESPRTTKLYDRTKDRLTPSEVEKIRL
jgi:hypothetical protein